MNSLNNTYNYLPPQSSLRPVALLPLLSLLSLLSDISAVDLSRSTIESALNQWAVSSSEKVQFLTSASEIYQSAGALPKALELSIVALGESVEPKLVEKAVVLSLAVEDKFDLTEVLKVQGARDQISGKLGELVALFTEVDELEAVEKGQSWISSNSSFIENAGTSTGLPIRAVEQSG